MARKSAVLYFLFIGVGTLANAGPMTWTVQSVQFQVGSSVGSLLSDPDADTYSDSAAELPGEPYDPIGDTLTPASRGTQEESSLLVLPDGPDVDLPDIDVSDLFAAASSSDNLTVGLDATTLIGRSVGTRGNAPPGRVQNSAAVTDPGRVEIMLGGLGLLIGGFILYLGVSVRKVAQSSSEFLKAHSAM